MKAEQISFAGMQSPWPSAKVIPTKTGRLELRYVLVNTPSALGSMEVALAGSDMIAHDTETSGLFVALGARVIGHAFAHFSGPTQITAYYVPIRHVGGHNENEPQLPVDRVSAVVQRVLDAAKLVLYHHGKFDWGQSRADGVVFKSAFDDVATIATAENENEPSFALKRLASKYCTKDAANEQEELNEWMRKDARKLGLPFKKRKKEKDGLLGEPSYVERFGFSRTPITTCGKYACHDVFYTLYLRAFKYVDTRTQWATVIDRENHVSRILHGMEWEGLEADAALIRDTHDWCGREYHHWLAEARRHTGNPGFEGTDAELRTLLYAHYRMAVPKTTKNKQPSVDREARGLLAAKYPQFAPLLEVLDKLSRAQKLYTTYTANFLRFVSPDDGRIHASYNQLERREQGGAPRTGRLSSADPNMQNIDSRPLELLDGSFVEIRRYFTVPEGYVRFYIDFSQIELRVLTWFCQDPVLLRCYQQGLDVHQIIADQLGILRKIAKQVNFGNSYGMTEIGLALRLPGYFQDPEGTRRFAKQVLDAYFRRYRNIQLFKVQAANEMRANGCLYVNPFGRPRRIPILNADEDWLRAKGERQMMSSIVSGTAADIMKESMIRCDGIVQSRHTPAKQVQTIHDELVFDAPLDSPWATTLIKLVRAMEDWPMFSDPHDREGVPIKVSVDISTTTWADKKAVEVLADNTLRWAA